jgi:hypothetical protein
MLKKAKNETAFAKVGIYGDAGSGKTFTASCMAIGLHKFAKCTKPIGFFDTEPALSYVLPLFEAAGIEVLCFDSSRALSDLMKFMDEAEQLCSIVIIDSITHVWRDVQKSYIEKVNEVKKRKRLPLLEKLEFQHWGTIKDVWSKFTDRFLSSKVHVILCGRLSSIYEYQTADNGKKELITSGTKMATEKELGYEPSLLIEMIKHRENGRITNRALIEKDRFNYLNGLEIDFPSHTGVNIKHIYGVFEKLKVHFTHLNLGGTHFDSMNARDSKDLYPDIEEGDWPSEQRQRAIWTEEIQGLLVSKYPGQTAAEKQMKSDLIESVFGTRSWTKVETTHSEKLKEGYKVLKEIFDAPTPEEKGVPNLSTATQELNVCAATI